MVVIIRASRGLARNCEKLLHLASEQRERTTEGRGHKTFVPQHSFAFNSLSSLPRAPLNNHSTRQPSLSPVSRRATSCFSVTAAAVQIAYLIHSRSLVNRGASLAHLREHHEAALRVALSLSPTGSVAPRYHIARVWGR